MEAEFTRAVRSATIHRMVEKLSKKEKDILRFIRSERHKTTIQEISHALNLTPSEVEVFVQGMLAQDLLRVVPGRTTPEDGYYTNPEHREKIFELLG
jgi:DNA-binding MarR family transcriptional regulator